MCKRHHHRTELAQDSLSKLARLLKSGLDRAGQLNRVDVCVLGAKTSDTDRTGE